MKRLIITLFIVALLATPALGDKPFVETNDVSSRVDCGLTAYGWVWDGSFDAGSCDTAGASIWAYGAATGIPTTDCEGEPIGSVLGTVLNGDYPVDSGERAVLGSFEVTGSSNLLEICHFYDIETSFDGGNVEIDNGSGWVVIDPMGEYPDDLICDSTSYYAWCVDMQPGFTGHDPAGFIKDCFDLSAYEGDTVTLAVKFGSDSSVTYPGWYISSVVAGGLITATEDGSWSRVKSLY